MSLRKLIIAGWLVSVELSWGIAQQVEISTAPTPSPQVASIDASSAALNHELATGDELVSILKHRLPAADGPVQMRDAPEWFQGMMQRIVRENLPDKYVQDKDWGKTDQRWNGLKFRRDGLKLSTKRQWKAVNHGTWKRYEITQVDPVENLFMRIENVHDAGAGKVGFEVRLASRLHVLGRTSKWAKGVQVYSVSAEAEADVEMKIGCHVGMRLDFTKFPPDVSLVPEVTQANLDVTRFELQRLSKLDGPVIKQLSNSAHKVLLDKIEEQQARLPEKINRQIAKNQDKLRLSIADFASEKWKTLTSDVDAETAVLK